MKTIKIIDLLNKIANENEYWQQLDDYGTYNTYFISTQGRICNQKGKILKQQIDKSGYPRIMLRDRNGKRKFICIHRLVAKTFILNFENKKFINHKDENPLNSDISNLEWCDMKYNNTYGNRVKKASASCKKKVQCIETGIIYDSATDVETKLNINRSHISDCCRGKRNKTGGYSWRFINE